MPASLYTQFRGSRWFRAPVQEQSFGPFRRGMLSDVDGEQVPPDALQDCVNFVIREDGSLAVRPGVAAINDVNPALSDGTLDPATKNIYMLGGLKVNPNPTTYIAVKDKVSGTTSFYYDNSANGTFTKFAADYATASGTWIGVLKYANLVYLLNTDGVYQTTGSGPGAAVTKIATSPTDCTDFFMLHDRMIVVTHTTVYWSKATDPSIWATPNGGNVNTHSSDGSYTYDAVIYQDALYLVKGGSLWRFSFITDPSTDGILEKVVDSAGGLSCTVVGDFLYFAGPNGVFQYMSGHVIRISQPIHQLYLRVAYQQLPSISPLDKLLVVGPLNGVVNNSLPIMATPHTVNSLYHYFIYDTELGVWYRWVFNPQYAAPNGVGGPPAWSSGGNKITEGSPLSTGSTGAYYWVSTNSQGTQLVRMQKDDLLNSLSTLALAGGGGYDVAGEGTDNGGRIIGGANSQPINILTRFKTSTFAGGDGHLFKRLMRMDIDADVYDNDPNNIQGNFKHTISLIFNNDKVSTGKAVQPYDVETIKLESAKMPIGKSFRFRRMAIQWDNINGVHPVFLALKAPYINGLRHIKFKVSQSREVTTSGALQ